MASHLDGARPLFGQTMARFSAGIVISRRRSSKRKYELQVEEAKEHFKSKLEDLQRKARKQYKNSPDEAKDAIASATARAGRA